MDSLKTTIAMDNLFGSEYPQMFDGVTIAASQTLARGAVLGKVLVEAGTAAPDQGNTGDGAISGFALAAGGPPKIGTYLATCIVADTDSGTFEVTDPDGILIGTYIVAGTFLAGGITFAIADGTNDFIVGDVFELPIEAGSGQAKILDIAATDGSQKFFGILTEAVVTASGVTQLAPAAIAGAFQSQALSFGGSTVLADVVDEARALNCYLQTSVADNNAVGG